MMMLMLMLMMMTVMGMVARETTSDDGGWHHCDGQRSHCHYNMPVVIIIIQMIFMIQRPLFVAIRQWPFYGHLWPLSYGNDKLSTFWPKNGHGGGRHPRKMARPFFLSPTLENPYGAVSR
jgi:hypothetical protein